MHIILYNFLKNNIYGVSFSIFIHSIKENWMLAILRRKYKVIVNSSFLESLRTSLCLRFGLLILQLKVTSQEKDPSKMSYDKWFLPEIENGVGYELRWKETWKRGDSTVYMAWSSRLKKTSGCEWCFSGLMANKQCLALHNWHNFHDWWQQWLFVSCDI